MNECECKIRMCKYFRGSWKPDGVTEKHYCKAFHHGMPDEIAFGNNRHSEIMPGQTGNFVYERGTSNKLVKPYPKKNMHNPRLFGHDNLCATIRDIYMKSEDDELRLWCRIAVRMAKNMYGALQDYRQMLLERGVNVGREGRDDWQLRKKSLYRKQQ